MKTKYIYIRVLLLLAVLSLNSCRDEDIFQNTGNGKEMCIVIQTQGEEIINTRTNNDDTTLDDVYALLFDGDGNESKLVTMAVATTTDTGTDNTAKIYFANIEDGADNGATKYCIVANTASIINGYRAQWETTPPTLAQVKEALSRTLSSSQDYITENLKHPPMASTLNDYSGSTTSGYAVTLVRATAKVTVTDASDNSHYVLQGANLGNVSVAGYAFADKGVNASSGLGNYAGKVGAAYSPDSMMCKVDIVTKTTESLYAFETAADSNPFVIIKGEYDGVVGYHRINLFQDRAAKKYYDIKRNYQYVVNINKIYTTGYATATEAINSEGSGVNDIDVNIEVIDPTSRDIISNGKYYLGLSNSEFVVYSQEDLKDVVVTTINHNAPIGIQKLISYTTTEGSGEVTFNKDVLSSIASDGNGVELKMTIPKGVIKGEFLIRMGDLAKKIKIERRMDGATFGGTFQLRAENPVYGKVVSTTDNTAPWIRLSTEATSSFEMATDEYFSNGMGDRKLYLVLANNLKLDDKSTNEDRSAELIVTKANDEGHSKILVYQPVFDIFNKQESPTAKIENPYVGAFWRASQKGERVIKLTISGASQAELLTWDAVVAVGSEWAGLKLGKSEDGSIYTDDFNDAENYVLNPADMETYITGSTKDLSFRIGVNGTIGADEHRYGLVVVNTYYAGVPQNHYKIFLRQGDAPDYLFRTTDGGIGSTVQRVKAVKISPYNLTDPKLGIGANTGDYAKHNRMPLNYNGDSSSGTEKFTKFPSQAGYFFVWNVDPDNGVLSNLIGGVTTVAECMRAIHPLNNNSIESVLTPLEQKVDWTKSPIPLIFNHKGDPCPNGYRIPSIGKIVSGGSTLTDAQNSEIIQSLLFDQSAPNNSNASAVMSQYTLWGYYADGFFDRLPVITQSVAVDGWPGSATISENSVVMKGVKTKYLPWPYFKDVYDTSTMTGNDVGYAGMVIFNPYNLASIFLPATGRLVNAMAQTGDFFNIWATERQTTNTSSVSFINPLDINGTKTSFNMTSGQSAGYQPRAVRCVKLKDGEQYP